MLYVIAMLAVSLSAAQSPPVPVPTEERIRTADETFWAAFNACDRGRMATSMAADIEFYHDKTGATILRDAVVSSLMDGPCGTKGMHVRRELVAGSLSYDEVPGFGAIVTGRHRFYAQRDGQPERLDGEARFAVVWQDVQGTLLMRRVLSYAHGPATERAPLPLVEVPLATLQRYVGRFASPMGNIAITLHNGRLHLESGGLSSDLVATSTTRFQARGRPLLFEFVDTDGRVEKVLVQENGAIVAEGARLGAR